MNSPLDKNITFLTEWGKIKILFAGKEHDGLSPPSSWIKSGAIELNQRHTNFIYKNLNKFPDSPSSSPFDGGLFAKSGALIIRTADCMPVLLFHQNQPAWGGIHAGWRGLENGILAMFIKLASEEKISPRGWRGFVGPFHHRKNYEVGLEFARKFQGLTPFKGKYLFDMQKELSQQWSNLNLSLKQLQFHPQSTRDSLSWYSHRSGEIGRNYSLISTTLI